MKRYMLLILLLLLPIVMVNAQLRPGVKFGVNTSNISNTTLDSKTGLYIGALLDIPITDYYTLQPEVLYSSQGGKSNSTEFGDVNIDYLSIAIPNKFYVGTNKGFHFILGLGVDINIDNTPISLTNGSSDFEISPIDVSVYGGIGYEFKFGLIFEARYKQGTTSTDFLGSRDLFEEDGSQLNSVFQIGLSYKFKIN